MPTPELLRSGPASKIISAAALYIVWNVLSEVGSATNNLSLSFHHEFATPGVGAVLGRFLTVIPGLNHGWRSPIFTQIAGVGAAAYLTAFDMDTAAVGYKYMSGDTQWFMGSDRPGGVYAMLAGYYALGLATPTALSLIGKWGERQLEKNESHRPAPVS